MSGSNKVHLGRLSGGFNFLLIRLRLYKQGTATGIRGTTLGAVTNSQTPTRGQLADL